MIEREEATMGREAKEGVEEAAAPGAEEVAPERIDLLADGEARDAYVEGMRGYHPGSAAWQRHCDLVARRLTRAGVAALSAVSAAAVAAPAALAQESGGGGGFDPQGMVRGFGEDIGWIILLLVLVGLAKAVWDRNVVTGVVVILVGGFFATLAMGPDAILDAGGYITGRAGLGGGGGQ